MPASERVVNLVEGVFHLEQLGKLHNLRLRQRLRVDYLHQLQIVFQILIQTLVHGVDERVRTPVLLVVGLDDLSLLSLVVLVLNHRLQL